MRAHLSRGEPSHDLRSRLSAPRTHERRSAVAAARHLRRRLRPHSVQGVTASLPGRVAGVTLPLSAIRTREDWGIGEIGALPACAAWIRSAGHRLLQILPPYELADGETSPYGARTAFGLDPIYISVGDVPDLSAPDITEALGSDGPAALAQARRAPRVAYHAVRALKRRVLAHAFARFAAREWASGSARARALREFVRGEDYWAPDLA